MDSSGLACATAPTLAITVRTELHCITSENKFLPESSSFPTYCRVVGLIRKDTYHSMQLTATSPLSGSALAPRPCGDKKVKRFHFSEIIGRLPYMQVTVTPVAGQIMVTATICKNTFGVSSDPLSSNLVFLFPDQKFASQFGMTYYINKWAARSGYIAPMMILAGLALGSGLLGLVMFWTFGKQFRRWTMRSGVNQL
jgi:hypothetical protein